MKIQPKPKSVYLQKLCVDCDTPFYVMRNHAKRQIRCMECQKFYERTYMREYQARRRAKIKKLSQSTSGCSDAS